MNSNDEIIIREVLEGHPEQYGELVSRYQQRLYALVYHLAGSREDAEDIVQEALATGFAKLDMFAGRSSFLTWIHRIAVNLTISRRRKQRLETRLRRQSMDSAQDVASTPSDASTRMEEEEQLQRVRDAILELDEERRTVLVLRDIDGLDYEAIAEVIGIPVGTVRSRLHRARADLRKLLLSSPLTSGAEDS